MNLTAEDRKTIKELKEMGLSFLILVIGIIIEVGIASGVIPEPVYMALAVVCAACLVFLCVVGLGIFVLCGLGECWEWITEEIPEIKERTVRMWHMLRHLVQRRQH